MLGFGPRTTSKSHRLVLAMYPRCFCCGCGYCGRSARPCHGWCLLVVHHHLTSRRSALKNPGFGCEAAFHSRADDFVRGTSSWTTRIPVLRSL